MLSSEVRGVNVLPEYLANIYVHAEVLEMYWTFKRNSTVDLAFLEEIYTVLTYLCIGRMAQLEPLWIQSSATQKKKSHQGHLGSCREHVVSRSRCNSGSVKYGLGVRYRGHSVQKISLLFYRCSTLLFKHGYLFYHCSAASHEALGGMEMRAGYTTGSPLHRVKARMNKNTRQEKTCFSCSHMFL